MDKLTLYTYFRSSAAYRVRIALNLKGLDYRPAFIHLLKDGGEQYRSDYRALNPQARVPVLTIDSGSGKVETLSQSLAIIEYLEERYPQPSLLPETSSGRAHARAIAQAVCSDIHPLNNLRVLSYLKETLHACQESRNVWYRHWISDGFSAIESLLARQKNPQPFCVGNRPTLADACLIPQVYNARRFDCALGDYPIIGRIYQHCMELEAFHKAAPEQQPDYET